MIETYYTRKIYKGFDIEILKRTHRYGVSSVTSYQWNVLERKTDTWFVNDPNMTYDSPETAVKYAQFWIEEHLKRKKV